MITRLYPNARGELQVVTLSQAAWEAMSQNDLDLLLGYGQKASAGTADPTPLKASKGKKK